MDDSSPLRKKQRLSHEATREALIEAGKQLLADRGLDTGMGLVSLNDAIVRSGVARASAYRAFSDDDLDPQVAFRTDLLITYVSQEPLEIRREAAEQLTAQAVSSLHGDPVELAATLRELIRLGYAGQVAGFADDPNWKVVGPSWAATAMNDWAPDELVEAHRTGNLKTAQYFIPLYQQTTEACGLRLRPELDWDMFALLCQSAPINGAFHAKYHPQTEAIMRPTGPDGAELPWSMAAILVEGLVLTSFVADPDAEVSADLSSWLG